MQSKTVSSMTTLGPIHHWKTSYLPYGPISKQFCGCFFNLLTTVEMGSPEGQALGYSVRSTTPAPRENVAVPALGNLLCPVMQGCRLSVLSFLAHHHYIGTGHTYFIPLNTINMTPLKPQYKIQWIFPLKPNFQ
jgi:hypothetical protein